MDFKSCTRLKLHSANREKKHARKETMTFHYEIQYRIISTQGACIGVKSWQKRQKNNIHQSQMATAAEVVQRVRYLIRN